MRWRKLGLVYAPTGELWWNRTHAYLPTPEVLDDATTVRIWFAGCDDGRVGRVGWLEVDARAPREVLRMTSEPVVDVGPAGSFDHSGVSPTCIVRSGGERRFYYVGWQLTKPTPYQLFGGLARIGDDGSVRRRPVPVIDRTVDEPYFRSAPFVLPEGDGYRLWYLHCDGWTSSGETYRYQTEIRTAVSADGETWPARGETCFGPSVPREFGVTRPWVVRDRDRLRMWYGIRAVEGPPYCTGYAESTDGRVWERKDGEVGLAPSENGWDSEMAVFASVVDAGGRRLMFYNGNGMGRSGFGVAVLESD